ncbi:NPCBM/NEW2 domain-containing protein [Paenibacillus hexagrammi]|uniref:Alpha-galactosidase n=1 Tax=Paenibacillus hexagrammi TaxID=2908839 RepID=A0ABY3SDA2_9BACL|nr:NPCBM/NEW2 domain-containing protein [Paenibacillus sp. YPD9-1]UJF31385.1 NPCBM/NEW2 domain-containing protein [Paenibacillus sp. YPD9-1]
MRKSLSTLILFMILCMLFLTPAYQAEAASNGLAETPPMGWNSWNKFGCNVSENMIKEMADAMVSSGMKDAGYQYVNIDDCWQTDREPTTGKIVADPVRFPSGMKALADYVHSKGLKLGLYTDVGFKTCGGRPGSRGYYDIDAKTYAEWGIDYVKVDWCYVDPDGKLLNYGAKPDAATWYSEFGEALKNSGRGIVFSICNWGEQSPWDWGPQIGNLWRTGQDIGDAWERGTNWYYGIINAYDVAVNHSASAGPGGWNDPDMLEIGNGGATNVEYRSQFSLWSMLAAPLIAGNDLRSMSQETKDILMNKEVIAVNQDPLGVQATKIIDNGDIEILVKPLSNGDKAIALLNRGAQSAKISVTAAEAGLPASEGYIVRDLWQHFSKGSTGTIKADVPSHGTAMFRVSPATIDNLPASLDMTIAASSGQIQSGKSAELTATLHNDGVKDVTKAAISLQLPSGWTAAPLSSTSFERVAADQTVSAKWSVTAPSDAVGVKDIGVTATYEDVDGIKQLQSSQRFNVLPPDGTIYVSDMEPQDSTNGWGPIEKDMSNGEASKGDGKTITIKGVPYNKGIGTNAASSITYNIDGKFDSFISDVGIDDEVSGRGSVTFEVWGDGKKLWDSGLIKAASSTIGAEVNVKGVKLLKLVVTDGGDGNAYDHGDWAGARLTATAQESKGAVLEGPDQAAAGTTFDLSYGLSGMDQNVYAQDLTFRYDPSQVEFVSAESVNSDAVVIVDKAQKQDEVRLLAATIGSNAKLEGDLLKLHWKVKSNTAATASTITLSKAVMADGTGVETELDSKSYTLQINSVDKAALLALITDAQGKHDAAVEGSSAGQYPAGSKAALQAAIDQAKAVADNTAATQAQVEQAINALTAALQTFTDSVITTEPGDTNGDGRYSIGDLAIIAAAYGKTSADPNWSSYKKSDLNNDGKIDIEDLSAIARKILE